MLKFSESVFIQQPIKTVFSFVTDLNNAIQWQTDVLEVELTSDGQMGPGDKYRSVNKFLGQRIEAEGFISEYKTEERCSFKFTSGHVTGESSFIFEPISGGTRFTTAGELTINRFSLAEWFVGRIARRQIVHDLQRLKHILEIGNGRKNA